MNEQVVNLSIDDIIPNRFQPREVFRDQALDELALSIKEHGVIQPIIVRQIVNNKYEIQQYLLLLEILMIKKHLNKHYLKIFKDKI